MTRGSRVEIPRKYNYLPSTYLLTLELYYGTDRRHHEAMVSQRHALLQKEAQAKAGK